MSISIQKFLIFVILLLLGVPKIETSAQKKAATATYKSKSKRSATKTQSSATTNYMANLRINAAKKAREKAMRNDPDGQMDLGDYYRLGFGVKEDKNKAIYWYRRVAMNGDLRGFISVIQNAFSKSHINKNDWGTELFFWVKQAAYAKFWPYQYELAMAYHDLAIDAEESGKYPEAYYYYDRAIFWAERYQMNINRDINSTDLGELTQGMYPAKEKCSFKFDEKDITEYDSIMVKEKMDDLRWNFRHNVWEDRTENFATSFDEFLGKEDKSLSGAINMYNFNYFENREIIFNPFFDYEIKKTRTIMGQYNYEVSAYAYGFAGGLKVMSKFKLIIRINTQGVINYIHLQHLINED